MRNIRVLRAGKSKKLHLPAVREIAEPDSCPREAQAQHRNSDRPDRRAPRGRVASMVGGGRPARLNQYRGRAPRRKPERAIDLVGEPGECEKLTDLAVMARAQSIALGMPSATTDRWQIGRNSGRTAALLPPMQTNPQTGWQPNGQQHDQCNQLARGRHDKPNQKESRTFREF